MKMKEKKEDFIMKRKNVVGLVIGGLCCLCLCMFFVFSSTDLTKANSLPESPKMEQELFPEEEIPEEYEENNLYVQMNNKLVKAMNDYEAGTISEEEYKSICAEISKVVSDKDNQTRMQVEEKEFNKKMGN